MRYCPYFERLKEVRIVLEQMLQEEGTIQMCAFLQMFSPMIHILDAQCCLLQLKFVHCYMYVAPVILIVVMGFYQTQRVA